MEDAAFTAFGAQVLAHADAFPDRRAVVCDGVVLTYGALAARARALAGRIQSRALEPGGSHRIGVLASNGLDYALLVTAVQLCGVTLVPLPGLLLADALSRMIRDAEVALLFHDAGHTEKARAAAGLAGDAAPALVEFGGETTGSPNRLDAWAAEAPCDYRPVAVRPDWASDLIYSSGTTGTPKGIVQSYESRNAQNTSLARVGVEPGCHLLHTVGLYSNFGLTSFFLTLWWGGVYFAWRKFSADAVVATLAAEPIDQAWFAPATLVRTLEAPGFEEAVAGRPCVKLCAGAPLSTAHKKQVLALWPGAFYDLYGQTETGTLALLPVHAAPEPKLGSVGAILPTVRVRILNDAGDSLPPGAEGEIAGHSPTLMTGFHAREEANAAAAWSDEAGRRYVRTGDVGRIDQDGYLWLCDRKKDMIISGGFNIYPADLEAVLAEHPAVFESAVIGCQSARWGETPVAFVTLRDGAAATAEDLREWANLRVSPIQRLAAVKVLTALPSGTLGKILKRELRDTYGKALGVFS